MELWDVTVMDWARALFAVGFGAMMGGLLRLVVVEPWVGVHVTGAAMAWFMADASGRCDENEALRGEIVELEKQVVVLKSAMHEMAKMQSEMETKYRRARFQEGRPLSTSSL